MTNDKTQLSTLLDLLISKGVYRFKQGDLEVEFGGGAPAIAELSSDDPEPVIEKEPTEFDIHNTLKRL